jgi:hypothetical protein
MENIVLKLIIESMRNELPDRIAYLKYLKNFSIQKHQGMSSELILKQMEEIQKLLKSENLLDFEKEEFIVINNALLSILDKH